MITRELSSSKHMWNLWGSNKERQQKVLHYSYFSWHHNPKEQSPNETCSSSTTFYPTPDSCQLSHSGYESLPNPCAKSLKTGWSPYVGWTADPWATKHNSRSNTRNPPERTRTHGRFLQAVETDKIWENNQTPWKTERLCHRLGILKKLTINTVAANQFFLCIFFFRSVC